MREFSGNKYLRLIHPRVPGSAPPIQVDVYCVMKAFKVQDCPPGIGHAVKKLLCGGLRGKNDQVSDWKEAMDAIQRAIEQATEEERPPSPVE